jgi:hypothetical protein
LRRGWLLDDHLLGRCLAVDDRLSTHGAWAARLRPALGRHGIGSSDWIGRGAPTPHP